MTPRMLILQKMSHKGSYTYRLRPPDEYGRIDTLSQRVMQLKSGEYLRVSFWARKEIPETDLYRMLTFNTQFVVNGKNGEWQWIRIANKLRSEKYSLFMGKTGDWYFVSYFIKPPANLNSSDFVRLFFSMVASAMRWKWMI
jgi:hypothetical protein